MEEEIEKGCCQNDGECVCDHTTGEKEGGCEGCSHDKSAGTCPIETPTAPDEAPKE